ncbi:1-phosphofructokinase family hexose kinase [Demequina sp.]|uniref:1-phosphofructokinase family hexose kinase n=1 Tax=Demequina sp. TaxID=2050685 RepID=UPI003A8865F4
MIVTCTPNPAIDVTITVPQLEHGGTNSAPAAVRRAGGKGINVARVAHQMGFDVHALTQVDDASSAWFASDLGDLPHTLVPASGPTRSSYACVETATDVTTIINERGAALATPQWALLRGTWGGLTAQATVSVVAGSMPGDSAPGTLASLLAAGRTGVPVIVDTSGAALLEAAQAGASWLKPNIAELRAALGEADPVAGARLLQASGAGGVIVSLGSEGLVVVPPAGGGSPVHGRFPHAISGNPTGAGDAAVAALAVSLDQGVEDPTVIARRCVAWSASAVTTPVAGAVDPSCDTWVDRVIIEQIER